MQESQDSGVRGRASGSWQVMRQVAGLGAMQACRGGRGLHGHVACMEAAAAKAVADVHRGRQSMLAVVAELQPRKPLSWRKRQCIAALMPRSSTPWRPQLVTAATSLPSL